MPEFSVSLDGLLTWCSKAAEKDIPQRMLFFEAEEHGWIHYVPRLLILLEGQSIIKYCRNGKEVSEVIQAPAYFYCARNGRLKTLNYPNKTLSFSYYPTYIRSMMIDNDGVNPPPMERDIYYHTVKPMSELGVKLIELLDMLHGIHDDESAKELLPILFKLTLRELQASSQGQIRHERGLWDKINTFLREHRNQNISRGRVAKIFQISQSYVSELSKKYTSCSFSGLKLRYQLEHAENLLLKTRLSINEIAEQSGFSCANYFIRRFKNAYGVTPHVYRNNPSETHF